MATATDYYSWLGVPRDAGLLDIKKSFRKLSLKFHPDKDPSPEATIRFAQVCEAFEVLSSAEYKGTYDLYGEVGLKKGVFDRLGNMVGGTYDFDEAKSPQLIFVKFFGTNNPYQALNDISSAFEDLTLIPQPKEGRHRAQEVLVSLEEVYFGCIRKVQHERRVLSPAGAVDIQVVELTIDVKPGTPDDTRFVFENMGNQIPGEVAGPAVYTLVVAPHDRFTRAGDSLVAPIKLPISKALCGTALDLRTLDGRTITVPVAEMITPGKTLTVPGEGMPIRGSGGRRGDLILAFELLFPPALTDRQRAALRAAFLLPKEPNEFQLKAVKAFEAAATNPIKGWCGGVERK